MKEVFYIQPNDSAQSTPNHAQHVSQEDSGTNIRIHTNTPVQPKPIQSTQTIKTKASAEQLQLVDTVSVKDTLPKKEIVNKPEFENFTLFRTYAGIRDSSIVSINSQKLSSSLQKKQVRYSGPKDLFMVESAYKSWVLLIVLLCTFVLILIRTNFWKYLDSVIKSLLNYQLAEKLMREKNALIRRAFVLLNLNYILCCGLFLYLVIFKFNISFLGLNEFGKFIFLLLIFISLIQLRLLIIYIIGSIFDSKLLFKEYVHMSHLLNKNLGLYLLPIVFGAFFVNPTLTNILFYIAVSLIAIAQIL